MVPDGLVPGYALEGGHTAVVRGHYWDHTNDRLWTCGEDGCIAVWARGGAESRTSLIHLPSARS